MERRDDARLFRWFVGLDVDDPVWDAASFTKNPGRLLDTDAASAFLAAIVAHPQGRRRMSREHFTVDGTLIEGEPLRPGWFEPKGERRR